MIRLDIASIELELRWLRAQINEIERDKQYGMERIVLFRSIYQLILTDCTKGEFSLPATQEAAQELWHRNAWHYTANQWKKFGRDKSGYPEPVPGHVLLTELAQLRGALERDLRAIALLELDPRDVGFYDQTGELAVNSDIFSRYPAIEKDIRAAGRCFGVAEYTSCVFHLGRATEVVVKDLARRRKIPFFNKDKNKKIDKSKPKSWGQLNNEMRGQITSGKLREPNMRMAYSHAILSSDRLRKLRNEVSHASFLGSKHYDEKNSGDEVREIWRETKIFLEYAAQTFPIYGVKPQ